MKKIEYKAPEMDVIVLRTQKAVLISTSDGENTGGLSEDPGPGE
jgi:hypothetical protein